MALVERVDQGDEAPDLIPLLHGELGDVCQEDRVESVPNGLFFGEPEQK